MEKKHSMICVNVHDCNNGIQRVFIARRITKTVMNSIANATDLTLKKMFDISAKLVGDKMRSNVIRFLGKNTHGNICH